MVGDAVCRFNPVYGQAMTVSALDALALRRALATGSEAHEVGLGRHVQRELAGQRAVPWQLAAVSDFRFPEVTGRRPFGFAFLSAYMQRVLELAGTDEEANLRFLETTGFRARPARLFHPRIASRVLWRALAGAP